MQRGTKPKASVIRLITHASGKAPRKDEPQPEGAVVKPEWLNGTSGVVWDQYTPELIRLGLLTSIDVEVFGSFCKMAAKQRDFPQMMSAADYGQLRLLGEVFSMTPSSRARVPSPPIASSSTRPKPAITAR